MIKESFKVGIKPLSDSDYCSFLIFCVAEAPSAPLLNIVAITVVFNKCDF